MIALCVVAIGNGVVWAEGDARTGGVGGKFVRLEEKQVGEREYIAIVIEPAAGGEPVTVLFSRQQKELLAAARKLEKGKRMEASYVIEAGQKWVKRMGFEGMRGRPRRPEGKEEPKRDQPRRPEGKEEPKRDQPRGEAAELRQLVKKLQARLAQLERQVVELKQQNARLKGETVEREAPRKTE